MAGIYPLSREGGPRSERFTAYVALAAHGWGFSAYNPMAGSHAAEAVQHLLAIDAERLAHEAASEVAAGCSYYGDITLAVVVSAHGMWTDRLATEVQHRTVAERKAGHGLVLQWSKEPVSAPDLRREVAAEAVRVMWTTLHPARPTLASVLAREGLAYALAGSPFGLPADDDARRVAEALGVLGASTDVGDIAPVLYGDPAASAHGWPLLGIGEHGGFRWAIARAEASIRGVGAAATLRHAALPTLA